MFLNVLSAMQDKYESLVFSSGFAAICWVRLTATHHILRSISFPLILNDITDPYHEVSELFRIFQSLILNLCLCIGAVNVSGPISDQSELLLRQSEKKTVLNELSFYYYVITLFLKDLR